MRKRRRGQSLIEFVIATTALVPIVLLNVDSFLILYGIHLNNTTCREAARIAASGEPRLVLVRAFQSVAKVPANTQGTFKLSLVAAGTSVTKSQVEALYPYGGQISGVVDVTTAVELKPLILCWFLGSKNNLRMQTSEEVPCTYMLPNVLEKQRLVAERTASLSQQ